MTLEELFGQTPAPIMVFAGAGASAPLGLPVMGDFLARARQPGNPLASYAGNNQLLERLQTICRTRHCDPDDLEDLLNTAREMSSLDQAQIAAVGGLWSLNNPHPQNQLPAFMQTINRWLPQVREFVQRAEAAVYQLCRGVSAPSVGQTYGPLFEELRLWTQRPCLLPIITTNYDRALDIALQQDCGVQRFWDVTHDGFGDSGTLGRDWVGFDDVPVPSGVTAVYAKLHGSLNWRKVHDAVEVTDLGPLEQQSDDRSRPNIIMYPGRKDAGPHAGLFDQLHDVLTASLTTARVAVVIGYANRDERIASLLAAGMAQRSNLDVVVVDPVWQAAPPGGFGPLVREFGARVHQVKEGSGTPECTRALAERLGAILLEV